MPGKLVHQGIDACESWPEDSAGELVGVVRLLVEGMIQLRVST